MDKKEWRDIDSLDKAIERQAASNREKFALIWRTFKRLVKLGVMLSIAGFIQMCSVAMLTTEETFLKIVLEIINDVIQVVKQ